MTPTLTYLGRVLSVTPVEVGLRFQQACTVMKTEQQRPSPDNGWQKRMISTPVKNWWVAPHIETGEMTFFALSGYGPRIEYALRNEGLTVIDAIPHGLPVPDFSRIEGTIWRGSQQEVMLRILANRCGVIDCSTGYGKSFLIGKIAQLFPTSKLVATVSSVDIARDLFKGIQMWESGVGFVGDGQHNPQRVTVAVAHSLKYCDYEHTNLVLGDECHTLAAPSFVESLGAFRKAKMIGFSASPDGRSDNTDGMIEAIFGPVIAKVPYAEAVQSGNVVPLTVLMVNCQDGPEVDHLDDAWFEREAIWANVRRNRLIAMMNEYVLRTYGEQDQILNMVSKTEHAFFLQQQLPTYKVIHGAIDPERVTKFQAAGVLVPGQEVCTPKQRASLKVAFEKGALRRAIATGVWSKGVNFQDLRYLVRADGLGSTIEATQVPGRLSRLGTNKDKGRGYLLDTYDTFSSRMEIRSKKRLAKYREHGWTIERLSL